MNPSWIGLGVALIGVGCATTGTVPSVMDVGDAPGTRTGAEVRDIGGAAPPELPDGVDLTDGLSEDEAVSIAPWNNPTFHADLSSRPRRL